MSIGENLRRLRETQGMTQKELAKQVGVSVSMICQIERGAKSMSLPLGREITDILHCSLDDLLDYESMVDELVNQTVRDTYFKH